MKRWVKTKSCADCRVGALCCSLFLSKITCQGDVGKPRRDARVLLLQWMREGHPTPLLP